MIESEREKLNALESEHISIGINDTGVSRMSISIPWEHTAHAYNMRLPKIYITPDDLYDEALMDKICSYKVIGCYIWSDLDDYSFLSRFIDLQDLNILNGTKVENLDFLSELCECRMMFLRNAKLKNLNTIVEVKKKSKAMFGCLRCIGLDNCTVEDISIFETEKVIFSEFLIWMPEGSNEKDRWTIVSAGTRRYYEFKE